MQSLTGCCRSMPERHRWFRVLQDASASLGEFPERCPLAPESEVFPFQVRHLLYGNPPHVCRILFTIENKTVYVLHIRTAAVNRSSTDQIRLNRISRPVRFHISPQDSVDTGLVPALLPEPGQQVCIQPHGHDCFSGGPHHLGIFPELFVRGAGIRVGRDASSYLGIGHVAQFVPIPACPALGFRCFASRSVVRAAPPATLR
jgi:hypothetical protein